MTAGLGGWGLSIYEYGERIPLAAELISPLPSPAGPLKWLIQFHSQNEWLYYATNGYLPTSTPWFSFAGFDAYPFRPVLPVYPDSST